MNKRLHNYLQLTIIKYKKGHPCKKNVSTLDEGPLIAAHRVSALLRLPAALLAVSSNSVWALRLVCQLFGVSIQLPEKG